MDLQKIKRLDNVVGLQVEVVRDLTGCKTQMILNGYEVNTKDVLVAIYGDNIYIDNFYKNTCVTTPSNKSLEAYKSFTLKLNIGEAFINVHLPLEEVVIGKEYEIVQDRLQTIINQIDAYVLNFNELNYTTPLKLK